MQVWLKTGRIGHTASSLTHKKNRRDGALAVGAVACFPIQISGMAGDAPALQRLAYVKRLVNCRASAPLAIPFSRELTRHQF